MGSPAKKLDLNTEFIEQFEVEAISNPILLFYQFRCPHCGVLNVTAKDYKSRVTRCSHGGCRKIIVIKNFDEIN